MTTLNIVGAGNVGKALGRVLIRTGLARVEGVLNRSEESAARAVAFLEQGRVVKDVSALPPADLILLSVVDDAIESCATRLADSGTVCKGTVVFHCSGATASTALKSLKESGAWIASAHPLKSFADPAMAAETFAGTPCAVEGDPEACERLSALFTACGAVPFPIKAEAKLLYHAGTVFLCNHLTALIETGLRSFEAAGIPREKALELAHPLMEETLRNNFKLGTAAALTGPIARGDTRLVQRQNEALTREDPLLGEIYAALSRMAVELARQKGCSWKGSAGARQNSDCI